jgi:hypothetical protein
VAIPIIDQRSHSHSNDRLDLFTLSMQAEREYLSLLPDACWPFQQKRSHDPFNRTTFYRNSQIRQAVSLIGLVLAAVLLISAIMHIYLVVSIAAKLGFLTMHTLFFALSVAFCTNARRVEVFSVTAAHVAVLVVFVSSILGGNKAEQCLVQVEGGISKMIKCPG